MSTYTDLHNRVKENVTIDYHNRITPQKVKLFNEENEYWGTFQGVISGANSVMSGGSIVNTVLSDVTFAGETYIPGLCGLTIDQLTSTIDTLSTNLNTVMLTSIPNLNTKIETETDNRETDDSILCGEFVDVSSYVKNVVSSNIVNVVLSNAISSLSTTLTSTISSISDELSTDLVDTSTDLCLALSSINVDLDEKIASAKDELCLEISALDVKTRDVDDELSTHISVEINDRITEDGILRTTINSHYSEFKEHELSNTAEFAETRKDLCATIEHERHYDYNNKFSSYPYRLKDFSVNSLQIDIHDGTVKYNETETVGYIVDVGLTYTLVFNNIKAYPELVQALTNGATFTGLQKTSSTTVKYDNNRLLNGYDLYWTPPTASGAENIILSTDSIIAKVIKYQGEVIGRIADYRPEHSSTDSNFDISSGIATIITDDSRFAHFAARIKNKSFDAATPEQSEIFEDGWECRAYFDESTQTLFLEDNLDVRYFQNIVDVTSVNRGYINDGNVTYKNNAVDAISVSLNDILDVIVVDETNSYENQYLSTERLSAKIDGLSVEFECYETENKWSYPLIAGVDSAENLCVGNIIIQDINTTLNEGENITSVLVAFDDDQSPVTMLPDNFSIELYQTPTSELLSAEYIDVPGELTLSFIFDKTSAELTMSGSTASGSFADWKFSLRRNAGFVSNVADSYTLKWKTSLIDVSEAALKTSHALKGDVIYPTHIGTEILKSQDGAIKFSTLEHPQDEIKFYVPPQTDPTVSREFMLLGKFNRYGGKTADVKLGFYTYEDCGCEKPIKIINHAESETLDMHDIMAKTNIPTTYQFNEISPNVFMAVNCEHYDTEALSRRLDAETQNRIDADDYLSTVIDQEIIDRISAVADLSDSISATVDELTTIISTDLSTVSVDLDKLEDHYNTNMSVDVEISALSTDSTGGTHTVYTVVDQLLIADEETYDLYRLTIRNGALNINKVGDISARFEHKPLT